jgi:hypothetical protein
MVCSGPLQGRSKICLNYQLSDRLPLDKMASGCQQWAFLNAEIDERRSITCTVHFQMCGITLAVLEKLSYLYNCKSRMYPQYLHTF